MLKGASSYRVISALSRRAKVEDVAYRIGEHGIFLVLGYFLS